MNLHEIQNYTGRFNISDSEAQRIAEKAETEAEFIKIWDSHDEWTDERIEQDALLMDSERVRRGWY
jgi:hypothetical protein